MATRARQSGQQSGREIVTDHEGFLRHAGFRWLKIASVICVIAVIGYIGADVKPRPNGGSWYGYTLGTIGALLIVWLTLLGYRKRHMSRGAWSLKAWTSAHVYLGLSLIVIATLHTGFQFGWNVHTLAYALMMLVILSGIFGISAYATLPQALSNNRGELTQGQMLDALRAIDRQLHEAAQPLDRHYADLVLAALEQDPFAGGLMTRLGGRYRSCATRAAVDGFNRATLAESNDPVIQRIESLLQRRASQLDRMRRHMRIRGLLEVWLYVHVPVTFALLAALTAHIISVFYYW
ncbi:hypothetical protein KRR38_21375 [Novosphingobium sp. G106]|uniref:hypothetical protein n=1 Tax=Novosphingobium sp. G106 TaxID=2849500 RepID=UPI001C2D7C0A|nr:hypothetical protein [Novosphingobium sp. G106]MBV1690162.1 hypothetical protein [Novosphingobium sp. G106]